ncbi:double-strand break repair protein AddB [Yoonia litorea]|uniref:Double-strand break repair protein AddB n=1 Tax=Yoonia litorea TaxID=1123755 RepID=A0A1I6MW50_9RHOB|nr:double-strand break repair protein AddB [Yoonia litorea]SFS19831.1 double-strand break repair protein AddB [Yoonia litorea]
MFDQSSKPRIFGMPPGIDFAESLVRGLENRCGDYNPADWARVEIFVNTARMQRRIRAVFDAGPARLLPRIRLITDLADDPLSLGVPPAVSPLRRRLELSQFVAKLLESQPDLAPRAALYDLSDSLAKLMDEMQGEGVDPDVLVNLDVTDQSGHWERALAFLRIITPFFNRADQAPDKEARQRLVVENLSKVWSDTPPEHPVIIAGSTGSRGTTALLMQAVSKLPQGAIILPGFDFDLPPKVWDGMTDDLKFEDHPQFRFRRLMELIGFAPQDVAEWEQTRPANPKRNALVSLSLRPAPVTDQWLTDGPTLGNLLEATRDVTLVEAPSPRAEAETIALRLRQAVDDGITAALISPDRTLTRQVAAALDRWDITPDDSAGIPLALSPPGRFLRHVADLFGKPLTGEALLTLLKHPLCHSEHPDRGAHLRHTRELELHLRRNGPAFPDAQALLAWANSAEGRSVWADWLVAHMTDLEVDTDRPLSERLERHIALAEALAAGPNGIDAGGLWAKNAGHEAQRICGQLQDAADAGGVMNAREYASLFAGVMNDGVVRDRDAGHPNILIWGTLEARVQGADLTILAGMNDGVWPEAPAPDPWLNRVMRAKAGLLLPERRIGLSAHDYQQAMGGADIWITRSKRSADAETVPSRWVNRLVNLMKGLPAQNGEAALHAMRARGDHWIEIANALSSPKDRTPPAPRPSPCPPPSARPDQLSVTQIKTLVRDPFAIYARKVLHLDPLDPLTPQADAPLKGIIIHKILELFIRNGHGPNDRDALLAIAEEEFTANCPWPTVRAQWMSRFRQIADAFLADEADRQAKARTIKTELWGETKVGASGVKLTCKADRIDLTETDEALIYDYKTGAVPTKPQQESFDKQLLLEAAMVTRGAFTAIGPKQVQAAAFLGVNAAMKTSAAPLDTHPPEKVWAELQQLFEAWGQHKRGYTARLALFSKTEVSPYDHLSRYGEWDTSQDPESEKLT